MAKAPESPLKVGWEEWLKPLESRLKAAGEPKMLHRGEASEHKKTPFQPTDTQVSWNRATKYQR